MSQGCDHTAPQKACGTPYRYTDTFGYVVAEAVNATHARFATQMVSGNLGDAFWIVRQQAAGPSPP